MTATAILATVSTKICSKCGEFKQAFGARNVCTPCIKAYDKHRSANLTKEQRLIKAQKLAKNVTAEIKLIRCEKQRLRALSMSPEKKQEKKIRDNLRVAMLSDDAKKARNEKARGRLASMEPEKREAFRLKKAKLFLVWRAEKYKFDPVFKARVNIRSLISKSFRRNGYKKYSKTSEIIGCDWSFFKSHIERQFLKGMDWEKMGTEIHIDHITPVSSASTEEEVVSLNHFTNLRPMWAKDNLSKGAQITHLI